MEPKSLADEVGYLLDLARRENKLWPRPIPVSERLPEVEESVLVYHVYCDGSATWRTAHRDNSEWILHYDETEDVANITHWLPMPPDPE